MLVFGSCFSSLFVFCDLFLLYNFQEDRCKFWVWDDDLAKQLNQGCTSSLEVNHYLSQVEDLKQKLIAAEDKLVSDENIICVYDE